MILTPEHAEANKKAADKARAGRCLCGRCGAKLIGVWQICECHGGTATKIDVKMVDDGVMTVENERCEPSI